ncbi:MAG: hypothetical protein Q9159_006082 [Coniocarpon cinnabarinum]
MPSPPSSSTAPVTTPEKILATLPSTTHPPKALAKVLEESESQWIFSDAEMGRTPSIRAGMDPDQERKLRGKGLSFIAQAGIMLRLPQIALHTAGLFFNRFLMRYSLQVGALALHLSTKVSETPRKLRDIIVSCVRVALHNANLLVPEDTKDFWRWRDTLLLNEDLMLETLCFDLHVESPHRILFDTLKSLGAEHHKRLRNAAWAFVNDAGATTLGLRFHAKTIAASAIYAAAKHCEHQGETEGVRFKDDARTGRPWWSAHGVELREIRRCCNAMADLYEAEPIRAGGTPGRDVATGELLMGEVERDAGSKENGANGAINGDEGTQGLYKRLRTPSQGPEDDAPTRLKRRVDGSTKPATTTNGNSQPQAQASSQTQPQSNSQSQHPQQSHREQAQNDHKQNEQPSTSKSADPASSQKPLQPDENPERHSKKQRTDEHGSGPGDPAAKAEEDVSEEGEVDE